MQRLSMAMCPACERVNPPDTKVCDACGTPLVMRCPSCNAINVRSRTACHHCGVALERVMTEGGTEDAEIDISQIEQVAPVLQDEQELVSTASETELPEIDWSLSLRSLPTPESAPISQPVAEPQGEKAAEPSSDISVPGFLTADPDAPEMSTADLPQLDVPASPSTPPPPPWSKPKPPAAPPKNLEKAMAKARRRANVRRSRLLADGPAPDMPRDVLVLEGDGEARASLCQLLELFGFRPHTAITVAEAEGLSARTEHVAVFLGMGGDAAAAAELCRHLMERAKGRPRAVIAIGDAKRHTDRVRMELAGANAILTRPVTRGELARVLDDCELPLPHDPRHGAPPDL